MDDFTLFFQENYEPVRRTLAIALGSPVEAEEVTQEAFAKALARWERVSAMQRPATWVYVVAMNHYRQQARKRRPRMDPNTCDLTEDVIADRLSLGHALADLSARQRAAVVLRYQADLSMADIAAAMRCSVGTVKATLHQALKKLRVELDESDR